jgi:nucleoid DNA-binding protein
MSSKSVIKKINTPKLPSVSSIDLYRRIASKTKYQINDVKSTMKAFFESIVEFMKEDKDISIMGEMKISLKKITGQVRSPMSGDMVEPRFRKKIQVKIGQGMIKRLNNDSIIEEKPLLAKKITSKKK